LWQRETAKALQLQAAAATILNGNPSNLTEMHFKCRYFEFEPNLPQMRGSFEKRHLHVEPKVKSIPQDGPIRRKDRTGKQDGQRQCGF
jgi:hypothetical protein